MKRSFKVRKAVRTDFLHPGHEKSDFGEVAKGMLKYANGP
jgi:hypothetical protein